MISKRRRGILTALALIVLFLCLTAAAVGLFLTTGPSLQCELLAQGQAQAGWSAHTMFSGGRLRCYHLYVPPGYDPAQPAPLVVSLHGYLLNPNLQAAISGWHDLERVADLTCHFGIPTLVAINKWDLNPEQSAEMASWAGGRGVDVAGKVRYDRAVTQAQINRQAVVEYAGNGAAQDIRELWSHVCGKLMKSSPFAIL